VQHLATLVPLEHADHVRRDVGAAVDLGDAQAHRRLDLRPQRALEEDGIRQRRHRLDRAGDEGERAGEVGRVRRAEAARRHRGVERRPRPGGDALARLLRQVGQAGQRPRLRRIDPVLTGAGWATATLAGHQPAGRRGDQ
jgi:hypothetical protein